MEVNMVATESFTKNFIVFGQVDDLILGPNQNQITKI